MCLGIPSKYSDKAPECQDGISKGLKKTSKVQNVISKSSNNYLLSAYRAAEQR